MDVPRRHAATADVAQPDGEGEFMPTLVAGRSIDRLRDVDDARRAHQACRRRPAAAPETLTRFEGYYLDPASTRRTASKIVFVAGAASDQLYAILLDTPPRGRASTSDDAPAEIGGINPPNTLEMRWMPAAGGASTLVASAQGGRGPHFARNDSSRIYLTTSRGLQSIDVERLRPPHARCGSTGVGPRKQPAGGATRFACRRTARAPSSTCRASTTSCPVPRAGRETVEVRDPGRAPTARPCRSKRMSRRRRRLPRLDAPTASGHLGARARSSSGRLLDAAEPQKVDVVVERPRATPTGSVLLTGARIITMKGDEVIARGDVLVTGNRIVAVGARGSVRAPAGTRTIDVARQDHHARASSTRTRTCGRRAACTRPRCGSTSPTSPTA